MSSQTTTMLVVLLVCCCLSSIVAGALWGTNVLCDTTNPESQLVGMNCAAVYESSGGSPAPGPAATDPRASVWSSGQSLVSPETDLVTLKGTAFATKPGGVPNTTALIAAAPTVNYTFSMDLKLSGSRPDALVQVFYHNSPQASSATAVANPGRTPALYILNNGWAAGYKGCPHVAHIAEISGESWIAAPPNLPTPPVPDDVWTNVTVTASGSTLSMYINGNTTPIATAPALDGHKLIWQPEADPANAWKWDCGGISAAGQMKIANFYWWNTALTAAQIAQLKIPATPTPGVATTSYYMPEPFTAEKDFAGY